jgi:F420-dependent oxidoreductase-like protein
MKMGILLFSQATSWSDMLSAARRVDRLGYEHLWTWDHLYAIFGDPYQPIFEGWTTIAAWAGATERVRLGLMVGANTFRDPGLVAKMAATVDHASGGRAILGLGAAWFEFEHRAHGIPFGRSPGERLRWLDEAVGVVRRLLDGEEVTYGSKTYTFDRARHAPLPVQKRLPIMIGGGGERKTLRTVAKYADMWNVSGTLEVLRHKDEVLRAHCRDVGRDEREIERTVLLRIVLRDDPAQARRVWAEQMRHNRVAPERAYSVFTGTPVELAATLRQHVAIGFSTLVAELPSPFDVETVERLATEVRPLVETAAPAGG